VIDGNNVKWIGTPEGMVKIDGNNWTVYDTTNTPFQSNNIVPKTIDRFNNLWLRVAYNCIAKFDGINWTIYDTSNSGLPSNAVSDIQVDENNTKWIATNRGIGKFNDTTWVVYNTINSGLPSDVTTTIAIENNVKWIGTFTLSGGMAKFNDTSWVIYNTTNSGIPSNTIYDVEIDNLGIKFIGTYFGGVGRFNNILNNWIVYNTQNSGLPDNAVYNILTQNYKKWFATAGGLALFNDTNWVVFGEPPLPSYQVFNLGLDSNQNLWICTGGGLAIYNPDGIVGIKSNKNIIPENFILFQNYPNPFNPITNIEYQITKNNLDTKLIIYDITGKEILKLVNQKQNIGKYRVSWDASAYPSGVYFYKLEVDNYTVTKKLVLAK
jgi:ligand-binding sensor domain-containing protein